MALSVTQDQSVMQSQNRVNKAGAAPPGATDPRIAFFDQQAPAWDRTGPDPRVTRQRLEDLESRLALRPGLDVLEVGCGTGQITGWLVERVRPGRVLAVDFAPAMLERARALGVHAEFELLDICAAGPADRVFDVVLCFHSFPHFRDPAAALRHLAGALKPSGRLLVVHLCGSAQLNAFHQQVGGAVGHDHLPPAPAWPALLAPVGLRVHQAEDTTDLFWLEARPKKLTGKRH